MKKIYLILFASLLLGCFQTCQTPMLEENLPLDDVLIDSPVFSVKAMEMIYQDFPLQICCNGLLKTQKKADLKFESAAILKFCKLKNGQRVERGELIAILENTRQQIRLKQAKNNKKKATIDLNSLVLGHGVKDGDTAKLGKLVLENLKIQSGYTQSLSALQLAELEYAQTFLYAPFSGVIANLATKEYNIPDASKPFCTLLSNDLFEVEAHVLESDLPYLEEGQFVFAEPFAFDSLKLKAKLIEINPFVDEQGLIQIKASIQGKQHRIYEGMHIKLLCERRIQHQLLVPKQAVIKRSGRQVVFTYENGLAKWNYVKTSFENSTHYVIESGLEAHQMVIYSQNFNLGHDTKVELVESIEL